MQFEEKKFTVPELKGISAKTMEEHLKLYAGYVKNINLICEKMGEYSAEPEKNAYAMSELQRRFGFEFDGMRNHEIYFDSLQGGAQELPADSKFKTALEKQVPFEQWFAGFKTLAMTRGVGWAILYVDTTDGRLWCTFVEDHQLGQLVGCVPILALDMWEHAFVADYQPSGKKQYVEDFFANLNWKKIEENFDKAAK